MTARRHLVSGLLAALGLLLPLGAGATTEVVAVTGQTAVTALPLASFGSAAIGDDGTVAVLGTASTVFRRAPITGDGSPQAVAVFVPGETIDAKALIGAAQPALAPGGCVVARLAFADGDRGIYRRCGATTERLAGAGDVLPGGLVVSLEAAVFAGPGGHVAFLARLLDGSVAVVRAGVGPLVQIARTGDESPAGGTISSLRIVGVRTDGTVGFGATVVNGRDGLFQGSGTGPAKVVVEGDATLAGTLDSIDGAAMNGDGIIVFLGALEDGTRGIFRVDGRLPLPLVELPVRVGDDAPGVPGDVLARFVSSVVPSINASGAFAFRANLGGQTSGAGVFVFDAAGLHKVVTTREDLEVGTLTRLRDPVLADDGSVLVLSTPPGEGLGLFRWRDGSIDEFIRFGASADVGGAGERFRFSAPAVTTSVDDAVVLGQHDVLLALAPGAPPRVVAGLGSATPLDGIFSEIDVPAVGPDGRIGFRGEVSGGKTGQGVFVDDGTSKVTARAGKRAPGGGRFRDFPATVADNGPSVCLAGKQMAFLGSLYDTKALEGIFLRKKGRGGKALARTQKRAPGGGKYVSVDVPSVLDRKHFAFSALVRDDQTRPAIFWHNGRKTAIVARSGLETRSRLGGRFQAFSSPSLTASGLLFRADVSVADRDGLFLALDTRRGMLVGSTDVDDRGGAFRSFDRPVWAGAHVVFTATLAGQPALRGLFRLDPDGAPLLDSPQRPVETLFRNGDPAPGGGFVDDVRPPSGNAYGELLAIVRLHGASALQEVVRIGLDG